MEQPAETLARGPVTLRRYRPEDLDALERAIEDSLDHLLPWMPWAASHSRENVAGYLARTEEEWASGAAYNYAITAGGALAGSCSLMRRIGPGGLEIGYWLHPDWTGRGLATSASAALTCEAFRLPGTTHVEIHHDEANKASGAVPRRLGYTLLSRTESQPTAPGHSGIAVVHRIDQEAARLLL
jgi:ribosomal-protein-serine acetyltransferase